MWVQIPPAPIMLVACPGRWPRSAFRRSKRSLTPSSRAAMADGLRVVQVGSQPTGGAILVSVFFRCPIENREGIARFPPCRHQQTLWPWCKRTPCPSWRTFVACRSHQTLLTDVAQWKSAGFGNQGSQVQVLPFVLSDRIRIPELKRKRWPPGRRFFLTSAPFFVVVAVLEQSAGPNEPGCASDSCQPFQI